VIPKDKQQHRVLYQVVISPERDIQTVEDAEGISIIMNKSHHPRMSTPTWEVFVEILRSCSGVVVLHRSHEVSEEKHVDDVVVDGVQNEVLG